MKPALSSERLFNNLKLNFFILDAGFFTLQCAEVEYAGTTYTAILIHHDLLNVWRVNRENTLYAYAVRDFTNGEGLSSSFAIALEYYTLEGLDTLLIALSDAVMN